MKYQVCPNQNICSFKVQNINLLKELVDSVDYYQNLSDKQFVNVTTKYDLDAPAPKLANFIEEIVAIEGITRFSTFHEDEISLEKEDHLIWDDLAKEVHNALGRYALVLLEE